MRNTSQLSRGSGRVAATLASAALITGGMTVFSSQILGAGAASCSDVDVVFARGTGEGQGLGSVGGPFVTAVRTALPGKAVTSYAVVYAANVTQSSATPGSADLTAHVASVAASCPDTKFILGGYSQGATVVDKALGIPAAGGGTAIPAELTGRIAAVVAYGNPLGISGQTIAKASPTYGARSVDFCNTGDPVCGGGNNFAAHLSYASNGTVTQGARFAADLVLGSTITPVPTTPAPTTPAPTTPAPTTPAPTTPAPTTPAPTTPAPTTPAPTPTAAPTTPPAAECVTASNRAHVSAGRATAWFAMAFAKGSGTPLGLNSSYRSSSLRQSAPTTWTKVASC